jgi:hypothetical protein
MKRCHACQERFGLIRHYYNHLQFCSAICVASYRAALHASAREKVAAAAQAGIVTPMRPVKQQAWRRA